MAKVTLSIAGSDSCSGAGIQADLKTFSTMGVHGLTAVTAIVAESPHEVNSFSIVSPDMVINQLKALAPHYPIQAYKTGLLCQPELVEKLSFYIQKSSLQNVPLVIDPILSSSSGTDFSKDQFLESCVQYLFPKAFLITPNLLEAQSILKCTISNFQEMSQAAMEISKQFDCACLLKGGHAQYLLRSTDILAIKNSVISFEHPWINIESSHGTGCTLSAAITANLAKGYTLKTAVKNATDWLHTVLTNSLIWHSNSSRTYAINQSEL